MAMQENSVEKFVKTSLTSRINAAKEPDSNLPWTTGKIPWMRLSSNVTGVDSDLYRTLYSPSTLSSLNNLYDTWEGGRNLPKPGLISATVKHTGTLKTIKNVEVKYKCWSLGQLKQLEQLFMSLGKTVVLEYGWSIKPDGKPVTSRMSTEQRNLAWGAFVVKSREKAKANMGCYDAIKGVVSNFKWSQDSDGGFSCSTTLSGPAEMMMSTPVNEVNSPNCCKYVNWEEEDKPPECKAGTVISRTLQEILKSNVIPVGTALKKHERKVGFCMQIDKKQTEAEKEDNTGLSWLLSSVGFGSIMTPMKYITWAFFENAILNDGCLPRNATEGAADYTEAGTQGPAAYDVSSTNLAYRFDTTRTKVDNPKYMTSADPSICILPGQPFWNRVESDAQTDWNMSDMAGFYEMSDFDAGGKLGWLSSICINVRFIMICALESETMGDLANKVLDGINAACGNKWDMVFSPLPSNPAVMTLVDTATLGETVTPYPISIFGNNSIAISSEINTEVSDAVKAQIVYGSNSADIENDFSLFGKDLGDSTVGWNEFTTKPKEICVDETTEVKPEDPEKAVKETYKEAWEDLMDGVDPDTVTSMKAAVKAIQEFGTDKDSVTPAHPPVLPITFKFTMDGLNGFKWGNSIRVRNLPKRYTGCTFMVTAIDHSINADSWETSIDTILRIP